MDSADVKPAAEAPAKAKGPLVPLEEWAVSNVVELERDLMAAFKTHCKLNKVLHAAEEDFKKLYEAFKHLPA